GDSWQLLVFPSYLLILTRLTGFIFQPRQLDARFARTTRCASDLPVSGRSSTVDRRTSFPAASRPIHDRIVSDPTHMPRRSTRTCCDTASRRDGFPRLDDQLGSAIR